MTCPSLVTTLVCAQAMSRNILVDRHQALTSELVRCPYSIPVYLARSKCYQMLDYHDLAAGDAYRALLLADELADEDGEYHEQAVAQMSEHYHYWEEWLFDMGPTDTEEIAARAAGECRRILAVSLRKCGCLRSAYDYARRQYTLDPRDSVMRKTMRMILGPREEEQMQSEGLEHADGEGEREDERRRPEAELVKDLPDTGWARRELYPWNEHEPDRFADENLSSLNRELEKAAPKCSVRAVELPALHAPEEPRKTSKQLGLFANSAIGPGETFLVEASVLTANNRMHDPLCDACSDELPADREELHPCPDCDDTVFCSKSCFDNATRSYHPAVCGKETEPIGKEATGKEAADALYFGLLGRTIAMAETQDTHPLDLPSTRFLWGDFAPSPAPSPTAATKQADIDGGGNPTGFLISPFGTPARPPTVLPFSPAHALLSPIHLLDALGIDVFGSLPRYDLWVLNTLYAKFRGVASARLGRDGRPEVCAVHPLWCLANHSCAPNVAWEWKRDMRFWARAEGELVGWGEGEVLQAGVAAGDEIRSHYCDVRLGVRERREWALGALGGVCVCERCVWEDGGGATVSSSR